MTVPGLGTNREARHLGQPQSQGPDHSGDSGAHDVLAGLREMRVPPAVEREDALLGVAPETNLDHAYRSMDLMRRAV